MKKVTGIGGIFFKCKDPSAIKEWYNKHLGLDAGPYGASFEWRQPDAPEKKGLTQWNVNSETAKLYEPSTKDFIINYRVENLEALVEELKKENVTILDKIETYDHGKIYLYDLKGSEIKMLREGNFKKGLNSITLTLNNKEQQLSSGIVFIRFVADTGERLTVKAVCAD